MMAFYGVGNHGGGPTRQNLDSIRRLDGAGAMPRLRQSTPRRFFDTVLASDADIPVVTGDLQHHAVGCYSAHSGIKAWMRGAENALITAEAWATVAGVVGLRRYPRDELARAWKQVLFNQFHDTMCGTAIEPAYDDARDQLGEATSIAARVENVAIQSLSQLIDIPNEPGVTPIVVFNPLAWPVRSLVELEYGGLKPNDGLLDEEGRPVAFQQVQSYATVSPWRSRLAFEAEVPALGYRTYAMTPGKRPSLRPRFERRPCSSKTTSYASSSTRQPAGSRTSSFARTAEMWRTWPTARVRARSSSTTRPTRGATDDLRTATRSGRSRRRASSWSKSGPVRGILRVNSRYRDSVLTEDFIVSAHRDCIEQRLILDWREKAQLLKIRMPTTLSDVTAAYEIPYGVIERPADGAEEPGQRWIDASGTIEGVDGRLGLAVLNDGKYGFDILDGELGVTAVRSPIYAHHEPTVPTEGVRYQFQDQGLQRFTLWLVPHRGDWRDGGLTRRALELNQRPTVLVESFHAGPLGADSVIRLGRTRARDRRRRQAGRGRGRHRGPACRDDRPTPRPPGSGFRRGAAHSRPRSGPSRCGRSASLPGPPGRRSRRTCSNVRSGQRASAASARRCLIGVGCRSKAHAAGRQRRPD